ncbi:MAG: sulfatase family protein [Akkermansiaceae bacterium]
MIKKLILTGSLLGFSFAGLNAQEPQPTETQSKPNILFIFTDDWGWGDLSCHDHPYIKTPNIDRIANEGTDFQRFTVASGVCSPSRAAVMTGHFPARYAIDGHFAFPDNNAKRGMPDWLDLNAPTLPKMLQKAGYKTAHFGKWHLANNMIPDSPAPIKYGYDQAWAFNCSGVQLPVHEDVIESIKFIKSAHAENKPFFLNLWMHEPHTPFHTVPMFEWRFRDLENRADQIYASVLSHADDRIGLLLDTLDDLKITDNTLVVFSSDNGPARAKSPIEPELFYDTATGAGYNTGASKGITGGRKGHKATLYEGGIGVPFIARWPKHIPAGKIDTASLISAVDLLPTFCAIAGAEMPADYKPDGVDITNILKGDKMLTRTKPLFWKLYTRYAVVKGPWKLVISTKLNKAELYKIDSDVAESNNLAGKNPEVVADLTKDLQAWLKELPAKPTGDVFSSERKSTK